MKIVQAACSACGREQEFDIATPTAAHCERCDAPQSPETLYALWCDAQADKYPLPEKRHIGDGAYVDVASGMLKLSTERDNGEHFIFLGPDELNQLKKYEAEVLEVLRKRNEDE